MFLSLWREFVLLSLGSGIFCHAPTLLHPSDKVVPMVQQGGSNCPTKLILLDNLDQFSAKIQGGLNSPTRWF